MSSDKSKDKLRHTLKNNIDILINKVFRFLTSKEKKYVCKKILSIMMEKEEIEKENMLKIFLDDLSYFINDKLFEKKVIQNDKRQEFIIDKISKYLMENNDIINRKTIKILDIGGGNGNILSGLKNIIWKNNNINNFICLETKTDWIENYDFNNSNIIYKFWDNKIIPIENNSVDIILCMVTLHHMNNQTINNLLNECYRILKKNGYLIIKEHDSTEDNLEYIYWEHHLYHILDFGYNNKVININEYMKTYKLYNFKSKEKWEGLINEHNFKLINRFNRFLDGEFIKDNKNPSNMYWDIYQKHSKTIKNNQTQ